MLYVLYAAYDCTQIVVPMILCRLLYVMKFTKILHKLYYYNYIRLRVRKMTYLNH